MIAAACRGGQHLLQQRDRGARKYPKRDDKPRNRRETEVYQTQSAKDADKSDQPKYAVI